MSGSVHQHRSLPRINQKGEAALKAALPRAAPRRARSTIRLVLKVKEAPEDGRITTKRAVLHHSQGREDTGRVLVSHLAPPGEANPFSTRAAGRPHRMGHPRDGDGIACKGWVGWSALCSAPSSWAALGHLLVSGVTGWVFGTAHQRPGPARAVGGQPAGTRLCPGGVPQRRARGLRFISPVDAVGNLIPLCDTAVMEEVAGRHFTGPDVRPTKPSSSLPRAPTPKAAQPSPALRPYPLPAPSQELGNGHNLSAAQLN